MPITPYLPKSSRADEIESWKSNSGSMDSSPNLAKAVAANSVPSNAAIKPWSYEEAFCRNIGLITREEQEKLRNSRVAIAGMGGVGGIHLLTLARLGIGKFTIADPDVFEVANFNRQVGATMATLGRSKVEVLAEQAKAINCSIDLRAMPAAVTEDNISAFVEGADVVIDGIDFFAIEARRMLFREARKQNRWAITAGPIGFGTAWLVFQPGGMSFDEYFDFRPGDSRREQLIAFATGLTPKAMHLKYMDLSRVKLSSNTTPCSGLACELAAGVVASQILQILLRRGDVRPAPYFHQFDPYVTKFASGYLRMGNRHPWQRFKRWWLRRKLAQANVVEV